MVVKVYVSGLSGNKEVKKRQQRVLMILDSKTIKYEVVDITEPANEDQRDFMRDNCVNSSATGDNNDSNQKTKTKPVPLPPQIFNDDAYCGDYDGFDIANEIDKLEEFLKVERNENELNGDRISKQEEIDNKQNDINSAVSDVIDKISANNINEDLTERQNNEEEHEEANNKETEEVVEKVDDVENKEEKVNEESTGDNSQKKEADKDEEEEEEEDEEEEEE